PVLFHQFRYGDGTLGAQQPVERHRAEKVLGVIDDINLEETVRQFDRFAQMVDGLTDGPGRRHRDQFGLHPRTGGIQRIFEAALDLRALRRGYLLQDLRLLFLWQILEQFGRVVGVELAHALRDGLRRQFLEDVLADRVVDFRQRREVELRAHQLD